VSLRFRAPLTHCITVIGRYQAVLPVDYLWVLLAAAGIVLIAPWTNNGINVLVYLLYYGFGFLYRPGRKGFKIMKDGEAAATGMLLLPY
jgi:hypothetical protein